MQNTLLEMYVRTSPFLRDEKGNFVNEAGEPLKKVKINTLPENVAKTIKIVELASRKKKNLEAKKSVPLRKHVFVNEKGEVCKPAPNPRYNERRVTVCALYDPKTKETRINYAICRNDDIVVNRYKKALGRTIAKARALRSSPVKELFGAERKEIISKLFEILDILHEESQYSWKEKNFSADALFGKNNF